MYGVLAGQKGIALFSTSQLMADVCRDLLAGDLAIRVVASAPELSGSVRGNFQVLIVDCVYTDLEKIRRQVQALKGFAGQLLLLVRQPGSQTLGDERALKDFFPASTFLYFPCEPCFFKSVVTEKLERPRPEFQAEKKFPAEKERCLQPQRDVPGFEKIVSCSQAMYEVKRTLAQVAGNDISVLLLGESGSGKSFAAEILHDNSRRRGRIFKSVNMAAIPESLAESTLFGSVKGAYTGAVNRAGLFAEAAGGTVFMDEIAEMPLPLQAKLLTFLDTKKFYSVGSDVEKKADVRLIFATNEDLRLLVRQGKFRKDLYYRICKLRVVFPPLRRRHEDIRLLAAHCALQFQKTLSEGALARLCGHSWHGNARELLNCVETACALCSREVVGEEHLVLDEDADDIFGADYI